MHDFNWRPYTDLSAESVESSQRRMAKCLSLAGLDSEILVPEPRLQLSPNFCQRRAAIDRMTIDGGALSNLHARWTPKMQLVAIHRVIPAAADQSPTHALTAEAVRTAFNWLAKCPKKAMSRGRPIKVVVGCYEPDHIVDERGRRWQGSIHAVAMIKAPTFEAAKACAHEVYGTPSSDDVYRPLVCKPVTDLPGAIRYASKSIQFGAITTRVRWTDADRQWGRKIALKAPERNELIRSMVELRPANRAICLVR